MSNNKGLKARGFVGLLIAAAGVFIICSIVQGIGGSSMFETEFAKPDNPMVEFLMQVTFYPGWIVTVGLIVASVMSLVAGNSSETEDSSDV